MKKLIIAIVILSSSFSISAKMPDIVALVNDEPITICEFQARKKMAIILNNIDNSDAATNKKLNQDILNILIEEELLSQHAAKVGDRISKQEVNNAIAVIEQRNKMPKGTLISSLRKQGVSIESFRQQIKGELIKYNIISSVSGEVSVSPQEVDVALVYSGITKDLHVKAEIFSAKDNDKNTLKQMKSLRKSLLKNRDIKEKKYSDFAESRKIDLKLTQIDGRAQSVILDTKSGDISSIYKDNGLLKFIVLQEKKAEVSTEDVNKIRSFISNKKMSQKAAKFLKDLKAKSYIKIMIP